MNRLLVVVALVLAAAGCRRDQGGAGSQPDGEAAIRAVTVGGGITEIAYALGAGEHIVGVDSSSLYPEEAAALPQVGSHRNIAAEGVLSLRPTVIIADHGVGPAAAFEQIAAAGVEVVRLPEPPAGPDPEARIAYAAERIRAIAGALGREDRGRELAQALVADIKRERRDRGGDPRPRVLFIYARGPNVLAAGGRGTDADTMIQLAGGENAAASIDGFKALTAEAVAAARPEVVLMLEGGVSSLGGADAVFDLPGLRTTPAAATERLITMDDLYFLGFGPRTGAALRDLGEALRR